MIITENHGTLAEKQNERQSWQTMAENLWYNLILVVSGAKDNLATNFKLTTFEKTWGKYAELVKGRLLAYSKNRVLRASATHAESYRSVVFTALSFIVSKVFYTRTHKLYA